MELTILPSKRTESEKEFFENQELEQLGLQGLRIRSARSIIEGDRYHLAEHETSYELEAYGLSNGFDTEAAATFHRGMQENYSSTTNPPSKFNIHSSIRLKNRILRIKS